MNEPGEEAPGLASPGLFLIPLVYAALLPRTGFYEINTWLVTVIR